MLTLVVSSLPDQWLTGGGAKEVYFLWGYAVARGVTLLVT
jgi:hypothetical protein